MNVLQSKTPTNVDQPLKKVMVQANTSAILEPRAPNGETKASAESGIFCAWRARTK